MKTNILAFCILSYSAQALEKIISYNNDFTAIFPCELIVQVIDHIKPDTIKQYAQLVGLSTANNALYNAVELIADNKWQEFNKKLLQHNQYRTVRKLYNTPMPKHYKTMCQALLVNDIITSSIDSRSYYSAQRINVFNSCLKDIRILCILKRYKHLIDPYNIAFIENLFFCPSKELLSDRQQVLLYQLEQKNDHLFNILFDFVMHFNKNNNNFVEDKIIICRKILCHALIMHHINIFYRVYFYVQTAIEQHSSHGYKIDLLAELIQCATESENKKIFNFLIKQLRNYYWQHDQSNLLCL